MIESLLLARRNFSASAISPMVENSADLTESLLLARGQKNSTRDLAQG